MGPSRVCIVTTVREPEVLLKPFVSYHREIGFGRFYLFFDDPNDMAIEEVGGDSDVTVVRCDESLRRGQLREALAAAAAGYRAPYGIYPNVFGEGVRGQARVMMRQQMNVVTAQRLAVRDGQDWLLSIDIDELFHCAGTSVPAHFRRAE
jgi:hypothetical protein